VFEHRATARRIFIGGAADAAHPHHGHCWRSERYDEPKWPVPQRVLLNADEVME
jgi:hypothetical protein